MKRLSSLLVEYNIGAQTLIEFIISKGYTGPFKLSSKVGENVISEIDKVFTIEKQAKSSMKNIALTKSEEDKLYEAIKSLKLNETKRIQITKEMNLQYKSIFGPCFYGAKIIYCIDPYLRKSYQFKNLIYLLDIILEMSINKIDFSITTCYDKGKPESKDYIENELQNIQNNFSNENLSFTYQIENSTHFHDRHIFIDNKFIIDLSRGLDIFENLNASTPFINKNCTIFITKTSTNESSTIPN